MHDRPLAADELRGKELFAAKKEVVDKVKRTARLIASKCPNEWRVLNEQIKAMREDNTKLLHRTVEEYLTRQRQGKGLAYDEILQMFNVMKEIEVME